VGKLTGGLSILALGLIGLGGVAFIRARGDSAHPEAPRPAPKKLSDASCLTDEIATRGPTPPIETRTAIFAGPVVKGRLLLPWQERKKSSYAYEIYVFTADGRIETQKSFSNTDRFELPGLTAGRKAVLFYPLLENLSFPYQVVDVPEQGEIEVVLRPRVPFLLSGRVVDANGAGVGGVTVVANEMMSLPQDLYLAEKPGEAVSVEKISDPIVSPVAPAVEDIVSTYVKIDPRAGRLSRGVTTDAKGHFNLPVTSATDAVALTVTRGRSQVLKEEMVLPGAGPVRIVVPNQ
jgi:hypothetical protein